ASLQLLGSASERQHGQARALSLYYRGAILNRSARYGEALESLNAALGERSDLILAREEKGESLWMLGRHDEAIAEWNAALQANPDLVLANYQLAGAYKAKC